jgi:copper(I)-binding protein
LGPGDDVAAEVTVEDAWARTSPMTATNGAAYMVLTSTVDDRLAAASVDEAIAASTEVRETVEQTIQRAQTLVGECTFSGTGEIRIVVT